MSDLVEKITCIVGDNLILVHNFERIFTLSREIVASHALVRDAFVFLDAHASVSGTHSTSVAAAFAISCAHLQEFPRHSTPRLHVEDLIG